MRLPGVTVRANLEAWAAIDAHLQLNFLDLPKVAGMVVNLDSNVVAQHGMRVCGVDVHDARS